MSDSNYGSETARIRQAASGDRDAASWLWERYVRLLYAMAGDHRDSDRLSGASDTSDIVAEVGARFGDRNLFVNVRDREHFKALLRQIITSKSVDQFRREKIRQTKSLGDDSANHPSQEDKTFLNNEMKDIIESLPMNLHDTVLAFMEFDNEREAAERLGITRHEFRKRFEQIRERLKQHSEGNA